MIPSSFPISLLAPSHITVYSSTWHGGVPKKFQVFSLLKSLPQYERGSYIARSSVHSTGSQMDEKRYLSRNPSIRMVYGLWLHVGPIKSGHIIICHQPRFPWNKRFPLLNRAQLDPCLWLLPFGVRSWEVAIIWPGHIYFTKPFITFILQVGSAEGKVFSLHL